MTESPQVTFPQKQFHMILQGHVLDCLARLPSDSIDTIITSPPYWGLRDYKLPPTVWDADPKCEHEWKQDEVKLSKSNHGLGGSTLSGSHEAWDRIPTSRADFCSKCSAWKGQLGLEPDFRLYVRHLLQITKELKRVLKPMGCLWINLGDTYNGTGAHTKIDKRTQGKNFLAKEGNEQLYRKEKNDLSISRKSLCFIPQRVALAMIDEQSWILRNQVVWFKPNAMPSSVKDRFSNRWEPMFFFTKEPRYWFDLDAVREPHKIERRPNLDKGSATQGGIPRTPVEPREQNPFGKNPGDIITPNDFWEITTEPHPFAHFAVYPESLVEKPIKASCPKGGIVLDPFAGSGTTGVVAKRLGRSSVQIELGKDYIKIIKGRMDWRHQTIDDSVEWIEESPKAGPYA